MTGGSRGVGRAVARLLHAEGARVVVCARGARDLVAAAKEIGEIICIPADVAGDLASVFRRIGRLDALVHAVGGCGRPWGERGLQAAVKVARAAWPLLRASRGCVVNVVPPGGVERGRFARRLGRRGGVRVSAVSRRPGAPPEGAAGRAVGCVLRRR